MTSFTEHLEKLLFFLIARVSDEDGQENQIGHDIETNVGVSYKKVHTSSGF